MTDPSRLRSRPDDQFALDRSGDAGFRRLLQQIHSRNQRSRLPLSSLLPRMSLPPRMSLLAAALAVLAACLLPVSMFAADQPSSGDVDSSGGVVVGINGHYRVGRVTAVRIDRTAWSGDVAAIESRDKLTLETLDGDGVRVRYDAIPSSDAVITTAELGYVVPGSEAAPLVIRRTSEDDPDGVPIVQTRLPMEGVPARGPAMIPSPMPWVVSIGDPLGVDSIGASNVLLDKTARIAVTKIDASESLPAQAMGYDGVDLVMINASGLPVLELMTAAQADALVGWLHRGGRLFVCLGEATEAMQQAAPWLIDLLPVDEVSLSRYDPAAFEMFAASQNPLPEFEGIRLPRRIGRALVSGRTTRRISAVQAAEYVVGFGHLSVVSADLDRPEFARWPERLRFVSQVVGKLLEEPAMDRDSGDRSTSFRDLAGQMRGTLDQFAIKPSFSFSLVSLILMLLIAAIGPLDYLLINRVWGKPLLGWLTFPLIAIALSVFLVIQSSPKFAEDTRSGGADATETAAVGGDPGLLRANQFQVTDIDLVDGIGRGLAWCSLYSHKPSSVNIRYSASQTLRPIRSSAANNPAALVYPMGFPGKEFGGIQLASENSVFPPYRVRPDDSGSSRVNRADNRQGIDEQGIEAAVKSVAIAPRSSKSFATRIAFTPNLDGELGVTRRRGSELLRGEFVNPLPFDVLDGALVYGNWVYLLPTRVPAGTGVANLNELRQKNFRWRLTSKQTSEKDSTETVPWSPGDLSDLQRTAQIMMFHSAAGGKLYTGLRHDVLKDLDLSEALVEDRCILVGRTETPLFDLEVQDLANDSQEFGQLPGNVLSMIRVVLPVRTMLLNESGS